MFSGRIPYHFEVYGDNKAGKVVITGFAAAESRK